MSVLARTASSLVILLSAAVLSACGASSGVSVDRTNADSAATDAALTAYTNLNSQSITSPDQWQTFAANGASTLATLRANFDKWSYDVQHTQPSSHGLQAVLPQLNSYRAALGTWLAEQERQAAGAKACLDAGPISQITIECYRQLQGNFAASGNAAAEGLKAARNGLQVAMLIHQADH